MEEESAAPVPPPARPRTHTQVDRSTTPPSAPPAGILPRVRPILTQPPTTPTAASPTPAAPTPAVAEEEQQEEVPLRERDFILPASIWLHTLNRLVARHVRLPRSAKSGVAGSQHPRFSIANSPLELVRLKCESAGLTLHETNIVGISTRTVWKGLGPMSAFHFCQTERCKTLGVGSAALRAPGKGKTVSDVLTMAIPPITVTHIESHKEWRVEIDMYLGVFHSSKNFTLPMSANDIYETDPTDLFVRMGLKVLKMMYERNFPLSHAFKVLLGPEYLSSASEDESSLGESWQSEGENQSDDEM